LTVPLTILVLDSSIPTDIYALVHRCSIPDEAISWIEAIVANEDKTRLTNGLRGDAAESFIDSVQEVCLTILYFRGAL
jgi:hypothetical protein